MKKYMFLLAAALFTLTLNAQRPERKTNPVSTDTKKSEATVQRTRTENASKNNSSDNNKNNSVARSASENTRTSNRSENVSRNTTVTRSSTDNPRTDNRNENSVRSRETQSASDNPGSGTRNENAERNNTQRTTTVTRENTIRTDEPVRSTGEKTESSTNRSRNENSVRPDNDPNPEREINRTRNHSDEKTNSGAAVNEGRTNTASGARIENSRREHSISGAGENSNDRKYEAQRRDYRTPNRTVIHYEHNNVYSPEPIEYRRVNFAYRAPHRIHVIWTPRMYHEYMIMYPDYSYWYYPMGYNILTISAYDALYHTGEVRNIYGMVHSVWYTWETDQYFLYFGAPYPYQDFTVIIPGRKARNFSNRPELFFEGRYIWVTGLISIYDGKPEVMIRRSSQIHLY